ncbi:hypothetical protein DTO96_102349 [Ephemeroptericola cinctiostellae]|uniref:Uncharacterized protein n=1 Tax=Ephemeroptericola cinctiostellae TaxID=2268024 RepID=A0A345DE06_9BURK|nr:hypothetical protein DTO96_102349 [Ephemeroptericola cinctiostellae]
MLNTVSWMRVVTTAGRKARGFYVFMTFFMRVACTSIDEGDQIHVEF